MSRPEAEAAVLAEGTASPLAGKDTVSLKKPQELGGLEDRDGWARACVSSQVHTRRPHACSFELTREAYLRRRDGQTRGIRCLLFSPELLCQRGAEAVTVTSYLSCLCPAPGSLPQHLLPQTVVDS